LALGIAVRADGAVLDARGEPASRLFAMGPPPRGMWWESTPLFNFYILASASSPASQHFLKPLTDVGPLLYDKDLIARYSTP
jgi:hypothetical protein